MNMLFARQPIFNTENTVVAYEFLYRNEVTDDISNDLEKTVDVLTNVNTFFFDYSIDEVPEYSCNVFKYFCRCL